MVSPTRPSTHQERLRQQQHGGLGRVQADEQPCGHAAHMARTMQAVGREGPQCTGRQHQVAAAEGMAGEDAMGFTLSGR